MGPKTRSSINHERASMMLPNDVHVARVLTPLAPPLPAAAADLAAAVAAAAARLMGGATALLTTGPADATA